MTIGGASLSINNNYNAQSAQNGENARPAYSRQSWNSIGEMEAGWRNLTKEWRNYYNAEFSGAGAEGNGKITRDELNDLLQAEFGGMGVKFTDAAVDESNPKAGTFEVYIDNKTRQKMADDPEYRAQVMAVIQSEMAGTQGYSVKTDAGTINDRTTGLSMNMQDGGPMYEGVPHSAGGTSAGGGVMFGTSTSESGGASKSLLDQILEKLAEKREELKEAEKKAAAKQAREDLVEISVEARATLEARAGDKTAGAEAVADAADEAEKNGGALNLLA